MKIKDILVEYKKDITIRNYGDKLVNHTKSFENKDLSAEQIITSLEKADPTKNKQYVQWIIKQYLGKQFRLEDVFRIKETIETYHKAKPRLDVNQRDINRFTFYQLDDLVDSWSEVPEELESTKFQSKNIEVLYDGPLGLLAIPKTEEASCELGSGTKWCTASKENNKFSMYNRKGTLYVFIERPGNKKYQFHFEDIQFMDSRDRPIADEKLKYFRTKHPVTRKLFAKKEKEIAKNPWSAYFYAKNLIKGRWPEAEPMIAKNAMWAYHYALEVIKGRWPEAEAVIANEPAIAVNYARDVIKSRWPEAEAVIAKDPGHSFFYASDVIEGRWPEAEAVIAKNALRAYHYALEVIKGRWPEAEAVIANDPAIAVKYARFIIKDRWPKGEPSIAMNPNYSKLYAERFGLGFDEENKRFLEK